MLSSLPQKTLYSVSADTNTATTINITTADGPHRTVVVYKAKGLDIDVEFGKGCAHSDLTPETIAIVHDTIKNVVQLWLNTSSVSGDDINLISTPFSANGLGIDQVLDRVWVSAAQDQLLISSGTTTQYTTLKFFLRS